MLPSWIMSVTKHWLLVVCYHRKSCQWWNTDYWSDVTLRNNVSEEGLTSGRMIQSGIMWVKKHWLLVRCYPRELRQVRISGYWFDVISEIMSVNNHWTLFGCYPCETCQWRNHDYCSDVTLGNHVSEETLTTGRILSSEIMLVKEN